MMAIVGATENNQIAGFTQLWLIRMSSLLLVVVTAVAVVVIVVVTVVGVLS